MARNAAEREVVAKRKAACVSRDAKNCRTGSAVALFNRCLITWRTPVYITAPKASPTGQSDTHNGIIQKSRESQMADLIGTTVPFSS